MSAGALASSGMSVRPADPTPAVDVVSQELHHQMAELLIRDVGLVASTAVCPIAPTRITSRRVQSRRIVSCEPLQCRMPITSRRVLSRRIVRRGALPDANRAMLIDVSSISLTSLFW